MDNTKKQQAQRVEGHAVKAVGTKSHLKATRKTAEETNNEAEETHKVSVSAPKKRTYEAELKDE